MTALIIVLLTYVTLSAFLGPHRFRAHQRWQRASPRLGLVLWTTMSTSWFVALLSAAGAVLNSFSGGKGLASLLHACVHAVFALVSVHKPADVPAAVALVGSSAFVLRVAVTAIRHTHRTRKQRKTHRQRVCTPSTTQHRNGQKLTVVPTPELAAYCVPGRGAMVVLTTGALENLSERELDAVVAHEQAHLRGKHHVVLTWITVLARAFPFVPLLRAAPGEVARLIEWRADDCAGYHYGRRTVAEALAAMATNTAAQLGLPQAALSASGPEVVDRVRRLLNAPPDSKRTRGPFLAAVALPLLALTTAGAALVSTTEHHPECDHPETAQVR